MEDRQRKWNRRYRDYYESKYHIYGSGDRHLEGQKKERVIDYNSKGEVRMRFKEDSPWNDIKEEKLLRDVLLLRNEFNRTRTKDEQILEDFIKDNIEWVEESTAKAALAGQDEAISEALWQIHERSLRTTEDVTERNYKATLLGQFKRQYTIILKTRASTGKLKHQKGELELNGRVIQSFYLISLRKRN